MEFIIPRGIVKKNFATLPQDIQRLCNLPKYTDEQYREASERILNNDVDARNDLIRHETRLAVAVALSWRQHRLPLQDRIAEALVGLLHAAKTFDFTKGSFASHAVSRIYNTLYLAQYPEFGNSAYRVNLVSHILRTQSQLEQEYAGDIPIEMSIAQTQTSNSKDSTLLYHLQYIYSNMNTLPVDDYIQHETKSDRNYAEIWHDEELLQSHICQRLAFLPETIRITYQHLLGLSGFPRSIKEVALIRNMKENAIIDHLSTGRKILKNTPFSL